MFLGVLLLGAALAGALLITRGAIGGRPKSGTTARIHPDVRDTVVGWRRDAEGQADRYPKLTPELVLAVIARESRGQSGAVGSIGEIGLMQLTRGAWQDYQTATNDVETADFDSMAEGTLNLRVGAWYLSRMITLAGSTREGLRAYNAGLRRSRENVTISGDYADWVLSAAPTFGRVA